MRILRILTRLNLGGPARQALAADTLLRRRGHHIRLLTGQPQPGEGDLFDEFARRGHDVVRIPLLRRGLAPARDLLALRRIRREIAAFVPDVVHTHASKAGALGRRALSNRAQSAIPRVHTFHGHVLEGYFPAPVSRRLIALERRLARNTDRIIAVSHHTAEDLLRLGVVGEEKLCVIQPGVELDELLAIDRTGPRLPGTLRALVGAGPRATLIGVVGRLAEVKQPQVALRLFDLLHKRHPNFHLLFFGDGALRDSLERRIHALGDIGRARCHLLGVRTDMAGVMAELDAVLLTSRAEGLPVALIEAAAAGLPVVARAVGGVPELVVHERTGFLGQSDEELAFALSRMLDHPEEARAMGARARLRIASLHPAERLAGRLEELYDVVVAERAQSMAGGSH
ncbi:MAG: hypothetical protein CMJ89_15010 [Planctomycetes bacterium]|jgi:glycosyltransferase involved in cell wall biosynthesis|nr:hypothetical protein [Planctomycetota bacterium]